MFSLCSQHTGLDIALFPLSQQPHKWTYMCDFITEASNPLVLNVKNVTKTTQSVLQKAQKCGHGFAGRESWIGVVGEVIPSFSLLIMYSCIKSQTTLNHHIFFSLAKCFACQPLEKKITTVKMRSISWSSSVIKKWFFNLGSTWSSPFKITF